MDTIAPSISEGYRFADLLAPMTPQAFFETVQRKRPIHIPGNADKFAFSMSWDLMNEILDQSGIWSPHTLQLVLDRVVVAPAQYTRQGISRDSIPGLQIDFAKVQAFVRQGATILLADVTTLTPGVKAISDALALEPGGKVQANLYCSRKSHQAFDVHYDVADVFVTQIVGEKRWRIYQQAIRDPVRHPMFTNTDLHRQHKGDLMAELVMRPGDVLYIPGGFCHEAMTDDGASIHITYEVRSMTGLDVIPLLFEKAVEDEVVRAPLPAPTVRGGAALDEYLMRLAGRMRELLRDPKMRAHLEAQMRDFPYPRQTIKLPDDSGKS